MRGKERRQRAMLVVFMLSDGCRRSIRSDATRNRPTRR
jgi:hypothetical protein